MRTMSVGGFRIPESIQAKLVSAVVAVLFAAFGAFVNNAITSTSMGVQLAGLRDEVQASAEENRRLADEVGALKDGLADVRGEMRRLGATAQFNSERLVRIESQIDRTR